MQLLNVQLYKTKVIPNHSFRQVLKYKGSYRHVKRSYASKVCPLSLIASRLVTSSDYYD